MRKTLALQSLDDVFETSCFDTTVKHIDLGDIIIHRGVIGSTAEQVSLAGDLYCPFDFYRQSDIDLIQIVNNDVANWMVKIGIIAKNDASKIIKANFAQFVSYTCVAFDSSIEKDVDIQGSSNMEAINRLLKDSRVCLPENALRLQTSFTGMLYVYDDWVEEEEDIHLIHRLNGYIKRVFLDYSQDIEKVPMVLVDFLKWHEVSTAKAEILAGYVSGWAQMAKDLGFAYASSSDESIGTLGYDEFCKELFDYLDAIYSEASDRIKSLRGIFVPKLTEEEIDLRRLKTSAVNVVFLVSASTCGIRFDKNIRDLGNMNMIESGFNQLCTGFNGLISFQKEITSSNIRSNEIIVVKESRACSLDESVQLFLEKVSARMHNTESLINNSPFSTKELMYIAVLWQWGLGSIPAQMCVARYSQYRDPYVPKLEQGRLGIDFWKYIEWIRPSLLLKTSA